MTGAELEDQLKLWESTPAGQDDEVVAAIAQNLVSRRGDEELFFRAAPRLPQLLVTQLLHQLPGDFDIILRAYNSHIEGSLPFEYCDVVANFYRHVFRETPDLSQKRLVLGRLISLGASHNRWHVGSVVAGLLSELMEDQVVANLAAEVIRDDPYYARWFKDYVANRTLPPQVKAAFTSLDPQADDIPF